MMYEVQQYCICGGWTNTWSITEDGIEKPHYFDSEEEAQTELDDYIQDMLDAVRFGDMEDAPDHGEFRIEKV